MLTPKQFATFTPKRREEIRDNYVFIPRNRHGVRSGYYRDRDIVSLLRTHSREVDIVLFVAGTVASGQAAGA